ncbi:hemolysin family protein [bacterium]|nr:hemolysin family protein [bacterium]
MAILILYLLIALTVSFICSLLESIMLSVTHAHIAVLIKNGHKSGRLLRTMKKNINHPLATILTLNTVANTVGAAMVGTQAYSLYGVEWAAFVSGILTVLILVFSEIIPKTLGAVYWKTLSPFAAYFLKALMVILYPIVIFLEKISKLISRKGPSARITREELLVLAEIGLREGILEHDEARILENLLLLREIRTGDILTPRSVMLAFQKDQTVGEVVTAHPRIRFSRIPVFGDDIDDITGVVLSRELLEAYYTGREKETIERLTKPIFAIPDSKPIADLIEDFINRREHIFLVVDEYGGTGGIVTLEDAVETLLGVEIVDEHDSVEDMRAHALEQWKKRRQERHTL